MSSNLSRSFSTEINSFSHKNVIVTLTTGKTVNGVLSGMRAEDLSIILANAITEGKKHHRMYISGSMIAEIVLGEAPFDMQGLRIELEKVFKKTGVRYFEDSRTLIVMDRYRVDENGVDGEGPVADRVRRIWQSFKEVQDTEEDED